MTDPTNTISTEESAHVLARAMARLAPDPAPRFWQCAGEPVLSVLLHAASPAGRGGGLAWVSAAVSALSIDGGDGAGVLGISLAAGRSLSSLDGLDSSPRAYIITTLCQALTAWTAAPA